MLRKVTFKGSPVNLVGRNLKIGMLAPDFRAVSTDLKETGLNDFKDKIKVITSFVSVDTPVCDLQLKKFNKRATGLSTDVAVVGISKDLPFAQKRFCQANEIQNVTVLSDYKYSSFGINYGLLVKEMNLLARGVVILDKNNILRYSQIVEELATPPDYEGALNNLAEIIKNPQAQGKEELPAKCKPCEGGTPPMPKEKVEKLLAQYRGWESDEERISKKFKFKDFVEAKYFMDLISVIAEDQGHHPKLTIDYNKLKVTLTTHAAGGLTETDFIMARIIDGL